MIDNNTRIKQIFTGKSHSDDISKIEVVTACPSK